MRSVSVDLSKQIISVGVRVKDVRHVDDEGAVLRFCQRF